MSETRYPKPEVLAELTGNRLFVIEASAGTGKTYTIEHLVVDIILRHAVPLEKILVVTFTERAAGELVGRVRGVLERILRNEVNSVDPAHAWRIGDAERACIEEALFSFDTASIFTIHSFCKRVLDENAFYSGRVFGLEVADGDSLFDEAYRDVLRRVLADEKSVAARLFATVLKAVGSDNVDVIRKEIVGTCHAKLQSLDPDHLATAFTPAWTGDEKDVVEWGADVTRPGVITAASALAQELLGRIGARLREMKEARGVIDYHDMLAGVWEALQGDASGELTRALREKFPFALIDEFQDTDPVQWKIFERLFAQTPANHLYLVGDPKQAIYDFRGADVNTYQQAKRELVSRGGKVVPLAVNHRSTAGLITGYNELLRITADGVRAGDDETAKAYFTGGITYDAPVKPCNPERKAANAKGEAFAPIRILELAAKPAQAAGGATGAGGTPTPAVTARKLNAKGIEAKDEVPIDELFARKMAQDIKTLLDVQGVRWPKKKPEDGAAPDDDDLRLLPKDIFVLTRTRWEGVLFAEHLAAVGVSYAFYKEDGLFETEAVTHTVALLRAIDQPGDAALRCAALATPYFGVAWGDLPRYRDLAETHDFLQWLREWKKLADKRAYAELFAAIRRRSALARRELFYADSLRDLTDYDHLYEVLVETAQRKQCDLAELARLLENWRQGIGVPGGEDGGVRRVEVELDPDDRDHPGAVQIMTLHKSKGLQAPVVYLFGGFRANRADAYVHVYEDAAAGLPRRRLVVAKRENDGAIFSPQVPDLAARMLTKLDAEDQRLYYVGLTRAESLLVVPYCDGAFGAYTHPAKRLAAVVAGRKATSATWRQHWQASFEVETFTAADVAAQAPPPADLGGWSPAPLPDDRAERDALAQLAEARRPRGIVSFTGSLEHEKVTDVPELRGPGADDAAGVPDLDSTDDIPPGKTSGTFLHGLIERVPLTSLAAPDKAAWLARHEIRDLFAEAFDRYALSEAGREQVRTIVWNALTSPLRADDGCTVSLRDAEHVMREPEFLYRWRAAGGGLGEQYVKGAIDFILDQGGKIYLGDWKGNRLDTYDRARMHAEMAKHNYFRQALIYGRGVIKLFGIGEAEYEQRFGGYLYVFLRGVSPAGRGTYGVYAHRPTWAALIRDEPGEPPAQGEPLTVGAV